MAHKTMAINTIMAGMGLMLVIALTIPAGADMHSSKGNSNGNGTMGSGGRCMGWIASLPAGDLTAEEAEMLSQLREEEKLARDVYQNLYEQWSLATFANIAQSEQRHMDLMGTLIAKYGIADPVSDDAPGIFSSQEMTELYEQLVSQGAASLLDALMVGASIEDLDLSDLIQALDLTDDIDIRTAYQNLMKGSRNHLRAFVFQIGLNGGEYRAQYISQAAFDAVIASPFESGCLDADGNAESGWGTGNDMGNHGGISMTQYHDDAQLLAKRSGKGGGRHQGPGDGTGNGGAGPKDGTGNGAKTGTCVNG